MRGLSQHAGRNISAVVTIVAITIAGCADETLPLDTSARNSINDELSESVSKSPKIHSFRWRFVPDTTYRWSQTLTIGIEAPNKGRLEKGDIVTIIDFDVLANEVAAEKAVLHFSVVRVRGNSDLPEREFNYDSAIAVQNSEDGWMAELMQPLLDVNMTADVDSSGVILALDVDAELKKQFQQSRLYEGTAILLEPGGLNSIFFGGLIPVPLKPIAVGEKWTENFVSPAVSAFGTFKMTFTPHYTGPVKSGTEARDKFDIDLKMEFDEPLTTLVKLGEQTSSGAMYFNQNVGAFERCEWTVDSEIIFNDGEAKGRMVLDMKSSFKAKTAADDLSSHPEINPDTES